VCHWTALKQPWVLDAENQEGVTDARSFPIELQHFLKRLAVRKEKNRDLNDINYYIWKFPTTSEASATFGKASPAHAACVLVLAAHTLENPAENLGKFKQVLQVPLYTL